MAERLKTPRERRLLPFDLTAGISSGVALSSLLGFASRRLFNGVQIALTSNLAVALNPEDPSLQMNDNPRVGALLIVNKDDAILEETFKVTGVSGSGPYTCQITPTAEQSHALNAPITYEEGASTPLLESTTPAPSGNIAPFYAVQGASKQTYRVSVLGTCNNGEIIEDETDLEVTEDLTSEEVTKQPGETKDIAVDFSGWLTLYSTALSSAIGFVYREMSTTGTVSAGTYAVGSTSISISLHPGIGAKLIIVAPGGKEDTVLVSAVSGAVAPFVCTVSPLQFAHTGGEAVTVWWGVSSRLLTSTTATIVGGDAIFRSRRGQAGQSYILAAIGTLADDQVVQQNVRITMEEE